MHRVISFGEILWDNFKEGKKAGGAPMNVALNLHKQGIESKLISSIGSDSNGRELLEFLKKQSLPTDLIQEHPSLPTGIVEVELDEKHHATYIIKRPVAWDEIKYTATLAEEIKQADALVFGCLACRNEESHHTLLKLLPLAAFKVFDMNIRPPHFNDGLIKQLLEACDLLKINEDELIYLEHLYNLPGGETKNNLSEISRQSDTSLICVTLGEKGAMVLYEGKFFEHPGFTVKVADTVGAGDAFLATFITSFLQKPAMDDVLNNACAGGALVASKSGANPDYSPGELAAIASGKYSGQV